MSEPAAPLYSPPLHRTSGQIKCKKTKENNTKKRNTKLSFALGEPSADIVNWPSSAAAAVLKILNVLLREKQRVTHSVTVSCGAASRTGGGEKRRLCLSFLEILLTI